MKTVLPSELIAQFLSKHRITRAFDVAGGMIAFIEDAISKTPGIECSPNHHEQACGFAAEGYARVTGNFGVALATSGPGATNLLTAVGSCYFDSVPALFITGQVHTNDLRKSPHIRQNGFQETDIVTIASSITKYAVMVKRPEDVLYELEKAYSIMKHQRPGPVLLDIPINVQRTPVRQSALKHFLGSREHKKMLVSGKRENFGKKIKKLGTLLAQAQAPVIIAGGGVRISETTNELLKFSERNNLPVVSSLLGLDSFPGAHPHFSGFIGSYGNRSANIVLANADLIIALGSRLDVRQTGDPKLFAKNAKIVHVDIDRFSIRAGVKGSLAFQVDLRDFFAAARMLRTEKKSAWFKFISLVKKEFPPDDAKLKHIKPNIFLRNLSDAATARTTVVSDVGNHQMWLAQSWQNKPGQRILYSGGMGSMGFGLPAAIGAFFADPGKSLVLVCGDGGFQMNIQELETIRRNKIPIKIFLLNNKSLGMVREFQDLYFNKRYQSTVIGYSVPDFKKIAYAYDLGYVAVEGADAKVDLKKILAAKTPILVEVKLPIQTKMEPKIIFGKPLDDQYPFLNDEKKRRLEELKKELRDSTP